MDGTEQLNLEGVESPALESAASPELRQQAEDMGWIPPERYKGDPERFVDAEEFIRRGEQVLPIVRAHNKQMREELAQMRAAQAQTAAALSQATAALDEIQERYTVERQRAVEAAKGQLQEAITQALTDGDHAAVAQLLGKMTEVNAVKVEPAKKATPAAPDPEQDPAFVDWLKDNSWYKQEGDASAYAEGVAARLRRSGNRDVGRAFFDKVTEKVLERFPELAPYGAPPAGKVAGAAHRGNSSRTGGRSYADLPPDARATCDAEADNFVGPNRKYKTTDQWRAAYARIYFEA